MANPQSGQNENGREIVYQKLRSPSQHGQRLDHPPLNSVDTVWQKNLKAQTASCDVQIGGIRLAKFREQTRLEVIALAKKYSHSYLDFEPANRSPDRIVMAGHQPELFHPGVWFKNFVLSNLGQRFNCTAINLVVDNDICGSTSIRYPKSNSTAHPPVSLGSISIDEPGPNEPFESQLIQDNNLFETFGNRVVENLRQQSGDPIANRLWPNVLNAAQSFTDNGEPNRFGHAIAAGRHRLEHELGLRTLEVPVSWISTTKSFSILVESILNDAKRFCESYNQTLFDYRKVHRIRSTSHPVPELELRDGWIEAPFWVWKKSNPVRRRLFSRQNSDGIELTDLSGWATQLSQSDFSDQFLNLNNQGIAIRPKALMTTMFSRLFVSDLFLHGIGGAKYDQLTDVIAQRFFSAELPQYLTLSATMKLPTDLELTRKSDVIEIQQQIRRLEFHPETFISNPTPKASKLIEEKEVWTKGERMAERSREKHLAIGRLNQKLAQFADVTNSELVAQREHAKSKIRESQILDSREYSFCLFPDSLIAEHQELAELPG